jgi:predicted glycogen debranching enzyme
MLNHLDEKIIPDKNIEINLSGEEKNLNELFLPGMEYLSRFYLEMGLPVWRYEFMGYVLEKKIIMPHKHNSVIIYYKLLEGPNPVSLNLSPSVSFRKHESPVDSTLSSIYRLLINGSRFEVTGNDDIPSLKLHIYNADITCSVSSDMLKNVYYRLEADRGYEYKGSLCSPGTIAARLEPGKELVFIASTENWNTILNFPPEEILINEIKRRQELIKKNNNTGRNAITNDLIFAADQFIITPASRARNEIEHVLQGEQVKTIIAGYHWFTDWGRDTMISLEGLTLVTGRYSHAKWILRTFANYVQDGLIPNLFPEGKEGGLYHTADASLWFFHALSRYLDYTKDTETLDIIFPRLKEIIDAHIKGTKFGIRVDPADGLLIQGEEGYQLTWMDAKVENWVVTPRRGKAVEINALWYNALCLFVNWLGTKEGETSAEDYKLLLNKCRESFNNRFWYSEGNYLYDIVDGESGDDNTLRPNQVFAVSLPNPILNKEKWESVLSVVKEKLLTPVGLRSLAPGHKDYKEKYFGDLRARDAAYHQGTVWAWLIGPFIDAWMKTYPEDKTNPGVFLKGFDKHLCEACVGSISEIFDAEAPFTARGCIAQAWSVAEVLRCYAKSG